MGFAFFLWVSGVVAGMGLLLHYEYTPSELTPSPSTWPANASIPRGISAPTLVMAVHPHCPCTRASIGELARVMSRCQGRLKTIVLFFKPDEYHDNWQKTDLWRAAEDIPGVTVVADRNGIEAARFHATTSGQTLLYDRNGHLVFDGGITASRGHAGDNDGEDAVVALVTSGGASLAKTSVFGCSLLDNRSPLEKGNDDARQ